MKKKLIKIDQLKQADIILSTTTEPISKAVKIGTNSKYSHARLYDRDGFVIEAVDPIVFRRQLLNLLKNDKYTAVYRLPKLTNGQAITIMAYATRQKGKPYDLSGAVGSAKASRLTAYGRASAISNAINPEEEFYCSELIAYAYKWVGIRLSHRAYSQTTPESLARSPKLVYVGHLKL